MMWIFVFFVSAVIHVHSQSSIYCGTGFQCPDKPVHKQHIMCNDKLVEKPKSGVCVGIEYAMSDADKRWIMGAHNCMRDHLAKGKVPGGPSGWPQAANMQLLTWDDELANFSRRWAFQCNKAIYECTVSKTMGTWTMMNSAFLIKKGYQSPSYKDAMGKWYKQINTALKSDVNDLTKVTGSTRDFWVMSSADAYRVGCAFVTFEYQGNDRECKIKKKGKCLLRHRTQGSKFVCVYGPFTPPKAWTTGTPCSGCKTASNGFSSVTTPWRYANASCGGDAATFKNLCADPNEPSMNETCILIPLSAPRKTVNVFIILLASCSSVYAIY